MKERLRWLGHDLRMKEDRLSEIVLFGQPCRAKQKAGRPRLGWEDGHKERFKGNGNFLGGCKEGGFEWNGGGTCVAVLASGGFVLR